MTSPWLIPLLGLPVFVLSYWTSSALYEFLRAYRSFGDTAARASTYPIEPESFRTYLSRPGESLVHTPSLTLGTLVAALRPHPVQVVEQLRRRYVLRLALLLLALTVWLTTAVVIFR